MTERFSTGSTGSGVGATVPVTTTMLNTFVSEPALLVAVTVNPKLPAVVGVPEITPPDESDNPAGRLPVVTAHVIGVAPVAASVAL